MNASRYLARASGACSLSASLVLACGGSTPSEDAAKAKAEEKAEAKAEPAESEKTPAAKPEVAAKGAAEKEGTKDQEVATGVESAGWLEVQASHREPKPSDPVTVRLPKIKVIEAEFDPTSIVGGSAVLEIDLGALDSGNKGRDEHLRDPDYLDIGIHPVARISLSEVSKKGEGYSARAKVEAHGHSVLWTLDFAATAQEDGSLSVKGEHAWKLSDLAIAPDGSAADDLKSRFELTLMPSKPAAG